MMARSAIRGGMGFIGILLSRAASSTSARPQPWGRVYSTALGVRGGASSATVEAIGVDTAAAGSPGTSGPTSSPAATSDPFQHLPGIKPSLLTVERTTTPREKQEKSTLVFGQTFSDHMLHLDWDNEGGWQAPRILPYGDLRISPAASSLHYGLQCFEGMKAYRDAEGRVRLFRPELNIRRLNRSMERLRFPKVDEDGMIELISKLVLEDADWIPEGDGYSLYLRPTAVSTHPYLGITAAANLKLFVILSPVGPYYKEGFNPIKLYADTEHRRAWPGGMGFAKAGGNYAPTIQPQAQALEEHGCAQVLWLFGEEDYVTEVGAMNIFFLIAKEGGGGVELVTSPLDAGDILDGVTRRSVLELAREWRELEGGIPLEVCERRLTMGEVVKASREGRLLEVFGTGTAAVISPVNGIKYREHDIEVPSGDCIGPLAKRFWETLTDIQYGRVEHPWSVQIS
ncbi:unnamed protein product [Ectocarpus sp. 12 AP-2014]